MNTIDAVRNPAATPAVTLAAVGPSDKALRASAAKAVSAPNSRAAFPSVLAEAREFVDSEVLFGKNWRAGRAYREVPVRVHRLEHMFSTVVGRLSALT
ncbi:hypothetical protein [Streptomyces olivoreticuli]|uniref:hypothetical protein n=1 Tax=Streptomyces olivoreticuli TaxID=68246 RepID=UPI0013C2E853|nr:hypothetical protein [Streptomyces olivoreticuli]